MNPKYAPHNLETEERRPSSLSVAADSISDIENRFIGKILRAWEK